MTEIDIKKMGKFTLIDVTLIFACFVLEQIEVKKKQKIFDSKSHF